MLTNWARLSLHESLTEKMESETRDYLKLHALMKEDIILAGRGSSLGNQIAVVY